MKIHSIRLNFGFVLLLISLSACTDWFDLRPQSETIHEEFWKDESDVKSMVGSCYREMNEPSFLERLIVWGEVRSDNVVKGMNPNRDITYLLNLGLNSTNSYTYWNDFYKVINYCNNVIYYAPDVRKMDPNFTEGQLRAYLAEVKGIRALCYFTLVRTFKDIPFVTKPTIGDSESFEVAQSTPEFVVDFLIEDLKSCENNAVSGYENKNYDKGRMTQKSIRALLADLYLWKDDYENCITYCNKILDDQSTGLVLEPSAVYNKNVFIDGNSKESIFELQFDAKNIQNYVIYEMYEKSGGNFVAGSRPGYNTYQLSSYDFANKTTLFGKSDLRGKNAYQPVSSGAFFPIMKYIANPIANLSGTVSESDYQMTVSSPNWIFYRLPDIYLMKAEALVEIGGQPNLEEAFGLVSKTYDRANPDLGIGSLQFSNFNSQAMMRDLVLDERQREFMFEGKRYFDLMRRIHREGTPTNVVGTYLMKKYAFLDQATAESRLSDMNALFMPINANELKLNTLLKQNPFYTISSDIE
ncbi:MAG TPA: RagB/SusD family nutrient uptake outer membrane protein [Bacteroidales bacterium]|nr:RagB/SusD family nutrient uptake outer membrane protein [Bacteroidales bacterium]